MCPPGTPPPRVVDPSDVRRWEDEYRDMYRLEPRLDPSTTYAVGRVLCLKFMVREHYAETSRFMHRVWHCLRMSEATLPHELRSTDVVHALRTLRSEFLEMDKQDALDSLYDTMLPPASYHGFRVHATKM
jgi:hypothetical protein